MKRNINYFKEIKIKQKRPVKLAFFYLSDSYQQAFPSFMMRFLNMVIAIIGSTTEIKIGNAEINSFSKFEMDSSANKSWFISFIPEYLKINSQVTITNVAKVNSTKSPHNL